MHHHSFWIILTLALSTSFGHAQSTQRSTDDILGFDVYGINALMHPDEARQTLLDAGFTEKGGADRWGKVPTATFRRDDLQIGLGHYEGRITGINATRIAQGDDYDYADELAWIREYFTLAAEDSACLEQDHGTRCGLSDGQKKGARFLASLTTRMIHVQVGAPR